MTEAAHPSLDEIAAYHAGTLGAAGEARLQDHFVACPRCTALLLERDELARLVQEAEPAPVEETAADWAALRARLRQTEPARTTPPPAPVPAVSPVRRARPSPPSPSWLALAASLLLAVVGLAVWNVSLHRRLAEVSQPQVNAPIQELAPGPLRGDVGEGEAAVLELAPGTRFYTLVLRPTVPAPGGDWEAEISRREGGVVWRGRGLQPNEYGSFSLTLPQGLLGEGDYGIRLRGTGADGRAAQDEYRLRIVARR